MRLIDTTGKDAKASSPGVLGALRNRDYRLFWGGSFVSNVGVWLQQVTLGWLVYSMTGSAAWLGTIGLCGQIPIFLLGLLGGAIADRASRRAILIASQLVLASSTFVIALLIASGRLEIWHLIAVSVVTGTANALAMPAMQSVIPSLVPFGDLFTAISLYSVQFNLARMVGPALGGLMYGVVGPAGCLTLAGITFLGLGVAIAGIRMPGKAATGPLPLARALREGLRYVRHHSVIAPALVLTAAVSVFGFAYLMLLPAVARDTLGLDASGLGLLMACAGGGAVLGGIALSLVGDVSRTRRISGSSVVGLGVALSGFALVHTVMATAVLMFVVGLLQALSVASLNTTIQAAVDDDMRGRVMSMVTILFFGLTTVGSFVLGTIGDRIGVPRALALGGCLVALAAVAVQVRGLRAHHLTRARIES